MLEMERVGARSAPTEPSGRHVRDTEPDLAGQLAALPNLSYSDLRAEWRRLYRASPPKKIGRDLLGLAVAWKLQERALGGLTPATRRRLSDLAQMLESRGDLTKARSAKLRPGARLMREWRGDRHEVLVTENGFLWRGERWRSLSVIAREITGTQWSGPRFFGLVRNARAEASRAPAASEVGDA
jgi:hypothetical protein